MNFKDMFNAKKKTDSVSPQDKELRMRQGLNELSRISKLFQTHASISIKGVVGTPPEKYSIVYHVDGLMQTGTSIEAKNEHMIEITLPPRYPNESPTARAITSLYHPNVSGDKIDLTGIWSSGTSLADCIVRIGELITFKRYSTDNPLNNEAAQWALRNKSLLPLSDVDLRYREIEEKYNADRETRGEIPNPVISKESDAEKTRPFDEAEQTKVIGFEDETVQMDMDSYSASDTVAIVKEQNGASGPETTEKKISEATAHEPVKPESQKIENEKRMTEKKIGEAAAREPVKTESPTIEKERKQNPMITQNKDEIKNTETGKEKILNKPVSAQISFGSVKSAPFVSQEKHTSPEDPGQSRQLQVIVGPFCHRCGFRVDDYANFCGRCGAKLNLKPSNLLAKIFIIIGLIAIPVIIFEMGSVIFLLNKKVSTPSQSPSYLSEVPQPAAPAAIPAPAGKKPVSAQEPSAPPIIEKSLPDKMPSAIGKNKRPEAIQEPSPIIVEKSAVHVSKKENAPETQAAPKPTSLAVETPKRTPAAVEAPKPAPVAVEAPKPAPAAVEAPKPAPAAVEASKPAPVAVEAPKPAPEVVEAPKAASPSDPAQTSAAKRRAAIEGFFSKSESTPQPENTKPTATNQAAVNDNLKLARLYMGIGSYDDAISRYREVVKVDPFNQEAIQGLMQAKKMKSSASGK